MAACAMARCTHATGTAMDRLTEGDAAHAREEMPPHRLERAGGRRRDHDLARRWRNVTDGLWRMGCCIYRGAPIRLHAHSIRSSDSIVRVEFTRALESRIRRARGFRFGLRFRPPSCARVPCSADGDGLTKNLKRPPHKADHPTPSPIICSPLRLLRSVAHGLCHHPQTAVGDDDDRARAQLRRRRREVGRPQERGGQGVAARAHARPQLWRGGTCTRSSPHWTLGTGFIVAPEPSFMVRLWVA
jgi:hypothetical protein